MIGGPMVADAAVTPYGEKGAKGNEPSRFIVSGSASTRSKGRGIGRRRSRDAPEKKMLDRTLTCAVPPRKWPTQARHVEQPLGEAAAVHE